MCTSKADDELVKDFAAALQKARVELCSLLPVYRTSWPDERERQTAVRYWKRAIEIAALQDAHGINSPLVCAVYAAPHTFHYSNNMDGITALAGKRLRSVYVSDSYAHHRSHDLRYIANPQGTNARVHQHPKVSDGDVDFKALFAALKKNGFLDREESIIVSDVFAEDATAHETPAYQHETIERLVAEPGRNCLFLQELPCRPARKEHSMSFWLIIGLAVAAVLIGLDKSLIPGSAILAVATLASLMPAKEATELTLIMAIVADWTAIWAYRHDIVLASLFRLLPTVTIGILAGVWFLYHADNNATKKTIGLILACFVSLYFLSRIRTALKTRYGGKSEASQDGTRGRNKQKQGISVAFHMLCGVLAGFTTMVANAGGPVTTVYFSSEQLPVKQFLGTTAAFYLVVNLVKLPFAVGLNTINREVALAFLCVLPLTLLAVICGRLIAGHVNQTAFSAAIYFFAVIAVISLLI